MTLAGVAAALGRERVLEPSLAAAIEAHYGERTNDALLEMARVPEGARVTWPAPECPVPLYEVEGITVFPGDPIAFEALARAWGEHLRQAPYRQARLHLDADEGAIAPLLSDAQRAHPQVAIGSYPRFDDGAPYRVRVTLEGKDLRQVQAALADVVEALTKALGQACLLSVDAPGEPAAPATALGPAGHGCER